MGQVEGAYPGDTSESTQNIYLDEEAFNSMLDAMNYSADNLTIPDEAFDNAFAANGTSTIGSLTAEWRKLQEMSNRYKKFMSVDVSGSFLQSIDRINEAVEESKNALNNS